MSMQRRSHRELQASKRRKVVPEIAANRCCALHSELMCPCFQSILQRNRQSMDAPRCQLEEYYEEMNGFE